MELTAEQVILLGLVASFVVQLVKLLVARLGVKLHRDWITVALFAIALLLAFTFARPALPAFPVLTADTGVSALAIIIYLEQWVALLSALVGFAVVIYNLLMQKVFEGIGLKVNVDPQSNPELDQPVTKVE